MVTKFDICDKVFFFNTSTEKIESDTVHNIRIIPTGIHSDEKGEDVCDEMLALYGLKGSGQVISEREAFASEDECREHYSGIFARI